MHIHRSQVQRKNGMWTKNLLCLPYLFIWLNILIIMRTNLATPQPNSARTYRVELLSRPRKTRECCWCHDSARWLQRSHQGTPSVTPSSRFVWLAWPNALKQNVTFFAETFMGVSSACCWKYTHTIGFGKFLWWNAKTFPKHRNNRDLPRVHCFREKCHTTVTTFETKMKRDKLSGKEKDDLERSDG